MSALKLQYNAFLKLKHVIPQVSTQIKSVTIKYSFYHIETNPINTENNSNQKIQFSLKNKSAQNKKSDYIRLQTQQKQDQGLKYGIRLSVAGTNRFKLFRDSLYSCKTVNEMWNILQYKYLDVSVFNVAMQTCFTITHDFPESMKVWKAMQESNIIPDIIAYGTIFNILCKCHQIQQAFEIYDHMTNEMKLKPNIIIINTLIAGCQHQIKHIPIAEKLFHDMQTIHELMPDSFTFNAMIAVYTKKANMIENAEKIWNEIKIRVENGNMTYNNTMCNTMMSAYAKVGNEEKIHSILELMKKYNLQLRNVEYTTLMNCYLKMYEPKKALSIHRKAMNDPNFSASHHFIKCSATVYFMFMEDLLLENKNEIKKTFDECYDIIMNQIPQKYGQFTNGYEYYCLKFGCVLLKSKYYNNDDIWLDKECIDVYHQMLEENKIFGLNMIPHKNDKLYGIKIYDLHGCSEIHAIFSLRYIFLNLVQLKREDLHHVRILCGGGSHSDQMKSNSSKPPLHTIAEQELLSWTPPIRCSTWRKSNSFIELNIADVYDFLLENSKMLKSIQFS